LIDKVYRKGKWVFPRKSKKGWKPEYNDLVVEMGKKGKSFAQIAAEIGISARCMREWSNRVDYEDFNDALALSRTYCEAWWVDFGLRGISGEIKGFSYIGWIFSMKARFGQHTECWLDTKKLEISDLTEHAKLTAEQLDEQIKAKEEALAKKSH